MHTFKRIAALLMLVIMASAASMPVLAAQAAPQGNPPQAVSEQSAAPQPADSPDVSEAGETNAASNSITGFKAIAAGIAIGIAAAGGAIAMGIASGKSVEGISRQPEADSKIRTTLMLGLVFIETAIIYALLVVILIIFVL